MRRGLRKLKLTNETIEIYKMLDFHLRYSPVGLLPFMEPSCPLPSSQQFSIMLNSIRAQDDSDIRVLGGEDVPEAQRVIECAEPFINMIERYGGLDLIREVFQDWEARYPNKAKLLRDWSMIGSKGIETMADVAENNGFADPSIPYRVREAYLMGIAYDIYIRNYVLAF